MTSRSRIHKLMNNALQDITKDDESQGPNSICRPRRKSNKVNKQNINSTNFSSSGNLSYVFMIKRQILVAG